MYHELGHDIVQLAQRYIYTHPAQTFQGPQHKQTTKLRSCHNGGHSGSKTTLAHDMGIADLLDVYFTTFILLYDDHFYIYS